MLEVDIEVLKGMLFIHLEGILNKETITDFESEINYLLYKQGVNFFVFDFSKIDRIEFDIDSWLENKLIEIFLSGGKVKLYGLDNKYDKSIKHDKFFYVREEKEIFNYLTI